MTKAQPIDLRGAAEGLFASPTLVDLLCIFCAHVDQRFFVNELIRRSGRFPRSVQLALAKLERAGLVRSERQGNARYYQVQTEHPFFAELRSLSAKVLDEGQILRAALAPIAAVRVAFLRPKDPEAPDLDLVAVYDGPRPNVESALAAASSRLGRPLSVELVSAEEWLRQAKRPRSFVGWLLEEKRTYVIGGDSDLPGASSADNRGP